MQQLRAKFFLFFLLIYLGLFAQTVNFSERNKLDTISNKVTLDSISYLNSQAKQLSKTNIEVALKYCSQALKLSVKIHDIKGMADCYNNMGIIYKYLGEYSQALNFQLKSLNLKMIIGDKKSIAKACNNVALVYHLQNDLLKALEYQLKGLKLKEDIHDYESIAISYENLGRIYSDQNNTNKALEYFTKAFNLNKIYKDTIGLVFDHISIGNEYLNIKDYYLAKVHLEEALKLKEIKNSMDKETADIYNSLADLNFEIGMNDKALELYKKTLELNIKFQSKRSIAISYLNIGNLLFKINRNAESEDFIIKCLQIVNEINAKDLEISIYKLLMELNASKKSYEEAFNYSKLYKRISDENSVTNNFEKLNELGIKYETDKKEKEISLLNKDKDLKTIEIAHQKSVRNYFIGLAAIILVSTFFIFRLYKNKQRDNVLLHEQKMEIEMQKKSITDSINYAYRIQKSILPSPEHFQEILPQSFVFNKPKDIVSGDFYWLHETSPFKYSSVNSKVLLAMADCTGHGVPGAFMSMIGVELLNEAVNESHSPAKIMQIVDEGIRKALHTNNVESKKDGMDMALCAFDFDKNVLKYCGANRPIFRIRNGEMEIFAPQKTAVGFSEHGFVFENREIDIQIGDSIYLFSDGYADQFGGDRDKKLTTKKFKDLLLSIQTVPMREQGKELENFIREWAGKSQQVDDMLVIGLKV